MNFVRTPLIAGNWKMHGSRSQTKALIEGIKAGLQEDTGVEVLVLPVFVYLEEAHRLLNQTTIQLGAQNLYPGAQGAYTGEVSGLMLKDIGCEYVLIGHSERRTLFHEGLPLIAAKFKAAVEAGLKPILCVGETKQQRDNGATDEVIREQIESVIELAGIESFRDAVIAYEPVWAIGTGLTATPEQAQAVHLTIREQIAQNHVDIAKRIRILYGGSMKADNAAALLAQPDIDGGLIGGASLDASSFLAICDAAGNKVKA
jgi:triosephosphate isomerase (TIM)